MELFGVMPVFVQLAIWFGLGVIIGSFLNVYIYRFNTGKSLSGHSHCLSCGWRLRVLELVPLLSYLGLRGRCRRCQSCIPVRYFLVELLAGVLFVLVYLASTGLLELVLGLVFVSLLVVIAVYDFRHMIIPDLLVGYLTTIAMLSAFGELWQSQTPLAFAYDMVAAIIGSLFFYFLWRASAGKWIGFGDVKLAFPLGLMVGCAGVFSMIVLAFWVGAIVGIIILALQHLSRRWRSSFRLFGRRLTMKSALPFAPFLIVGFLLVWFWSVDVISLLSYGA